MVLLTRQELINELGIPVDDGLPRQWYSFESIRSRIDHTLRRESIPTLNDKNIRSHRTFYHNLDWCSRAEIGKARVKVNDVNQYQSPAAGIAEF